MTIAYPAAMELKGDALDPADDLAKELASLRDGLDARFKAQETKAAERLDRMEAKMNRPAGGVEHKAGASFERKAFENFLRFDRARMGAEEIKTLQVSGDGTQAGFLAPPEYGAELIRLLVQYSPIRAYANVVTIEAPVVFYPRRTSSLSASWVAETVAPPVSQPSFEQISITPYALRAMTDVGNQLLEDNAYDLGGEILAEFAQQFGKTEGAAFVNGTGVGQPKGLLNATGIKVMTSGTGAGIGGNSTGTAGTSPDAVANIISLYHALPAVFAGVGSWVMNRATLGFLRDLRDGLGRPLVLDGLAPGAPSTLLGRPVVEAIDMPDIAAGATPILFGDLKGYRIVDRVGLSIIRDIYSQNALDVTRFYARKRVGADLTNPDRLVLLKCSA